MKINSLVLMSEAEARATLERVRWPDGPGCVHCGSVNVVRLGGKAAEKGLIKCRDCRRKFTVRVKTIFEDSPLPLNAWVYAFARMCASKKGVSAHQIHRELGVTYKTAWFMCHRIRHAMADNSSAPLSGIVESDEVWIGGKPRKRHGLPKEKAIPSPKVPVHTLVQRNGRKFSTAMTTVSAITLRANIRALVDRAKSTLMTDESPTYRNIGAEVDGRHQMVNHSINEYHRHSDGAGINTAESAHALIKRGVYGTFHHVSKEHLQRYLDEFDFRWNNRKITDSERTLVALAMVEGKRLTYQQPLEA